MENKTMTAPLAIIQINGVTVGKMKNIRVSESLQRGRVVGIGSLTPSELPALGWTGTLSCSSYNIDFKKLLNVSSQGMYREAGSVEAWANSILLQEAGLEISILRKKKQAALGVAGTSSKFETFAKVGAAFATRENFDIQEGQISGRDTEFEYLEPILYTIA